LPNDASKKTQSAKSDLAASENVVSKIVVELSPEKVADIKSHGDRIISAEEAAFSERRRSALRDTAECWNDLLSGLNGTVARR